MKSDLREFIYWADYKGGTNNLYVCKLKYPGDGAMFVAIGTSEKDFKSATKNAYRNLNRKTK